MMDESKWEAMRGELMGLTLKELKAMARAEHISLGYAGSRKDTCAGEIVSQRRYREITGRSPKTGSPWRRDSMRGTR